MRIPAAGAEELEFLRPRSLHLEPGKQPILRVNRLIAGSHGRLEYIYFTEPGEYTLTPRLRLTADGQPVTVAGEMVPIKVGQ